MDLQSTNVPIHNRKNKRKKTFFFKWSYDPKGQTIRLTLPTSHSFWYRNSNAYFCFVFLKMDQNSWEKQALQPWVIHRIIWHRLRWPNCRPSTVIARSIQGWVGSWTAGKSPQGCNEVTLNSEPLENKMGQFLKIIVVPCSKNKTNGQKKNEDECLEHVQISPSKNTYEKKLS